MDPADPLLPKILVLVILILINAFFAAAEIAVISLSETKLRKQAEEGDRKAKKLLALMQAPDSFLSAIQIAITLAGFLSSAFAADSFSDPLVHWLTVDKGFTAIPTSTLNTIMVVLITIVLVFAIVAGFWQRARHQTSTLLHERNAAIRAEGGFHVLERAH